MDQLNYDELHIILDQLDDQSLLGSRLLSPTHNKIVERIFVKRYIELHNKTKHQKKTIKQLFDFFNDL